MWVLPEFKWRGWMEMDGKSEIQLVNRGNVWRSGNRKECRLLQTVPHPVRSIPKYTSIIIIIIIIINCHQFCCHLPISTIAMSIICQRHGPSPATSGHPKHPHPPWPGTKVGSLKLSGLQREVVERKELLVTSGPFSTIFGDWKSISWSSKGLKFRGISLQISSLVYLNGLKRLYNSYLLRSW